MRRYRDESSKGKPKVTGSLGVYDIYKMIRKNKWYDIGRALKEHEFYSIIRTINNYLADEISKGNRITFPYRMGALELRKFERGVSIVDGKLKNTYPINWGDTLKLWEEDEEAKRDKILLRFENKYVYHIRYDKYDANYNNRIFYEFSVNKFIKIALKENIKKGLIDTLW